MKYWFCKQVVSGKTEVYIYAGEHKPIYNQETEDYDIDPLEMNWHWYDQSDMKYLFLKYPKDLKIGEPKRVFIDIKQKWGSKAKQFFRALTEWWTSVWSF